MKGVILAGGRARRLRALSGVTNKHLLPVYGKPMIYYALGTLLEAGINQILIVTNPEHVGLFTALLRGQNGSRFNVSYAVQAEPNGTAAALLESEDFVAQEEFVVVLGDNIFTENISPYLEEFQEKRGCDAMILVQEADHPQQYGVVVFRDGVVADIIEKPERPPSRCVSTGLWLFRSTVFEHLRRLTRSPRGEYEMTDVLASYAREGRLAHAFLKSKWMDVGTLESLREANEFFRAKLPNVQIMREKSENRLEFGSLEATALE